MKLRSLLSVLCVVGVIAGVGSGLLASPSRVASAASGVRLEQGYPSLEGLLAAFIDAVRRNDPAALAALRVSESEYRDQVMPQSVEAGQELQRFTPEASEYWWSNLDTRSRYHQVHLLRQVGGKSIKVKTVSFEKGTQEWRGYKAHRRLALTVEDESGQEMEIHTGSVIEAGGTFKFASFIRD